MLTDLQLQVYAEQMLIDYDSINPGTIFKDKIRISIEDAWRIQSAVVDLRKKRGEEEIRQREQMRQREERKGKKERQRKRERKEREERRNKRAEQVKRSTSEQQQLN